MKAAVMAGQVNISRFSVASGRTGGWRILLNLGHAIPICCWGAVAKVLADEGIELMSSTQFLEPLLAEEGALTEAVGGRRAKTAEEYRDWPGRRKR